MINIYSSFLKLFPPEIAHSLTLRLLKLKPSSFYNNQKDSHKLNQHILGLDFKNPVGLAAGFDKNAEVIIPLLQMGFGFVEAGTVTPLSQYGNEKPRVFRLLQDQAIINHLGFNNLGMERAEKKLKKINFNFLSQGIVGINIGMNKDSTSFIDDYTMALEKLGPHAHYVTINISSPNTPGLRNLQNRDKIEKLFKSLDKKRNEQLSLANKLFFFKISPDINDDQIRDIALMSLALGIDGLIISNSTTDRPSSLNSKHRNEIGGLTGKPLFLKSTLLLKKMYNLTNGQIILIGAGGISNGVECYEKIKSGASLVQLYTSLVYQGPSVVKKIKEELISCLNTDGFNNIKEAVGIDV